MGALSNLPGATRVGTSHGEGAAALRCGVESTVHEHQQGDEDTSPKFEGNIAAAPALIAALGVGSPKPKNWTVCHIWGYDDPGFAQQGSVTRNARYFTCVGNMVWLRTPLKGFVDALPEVKAIFRVCAADSRSLEQWFSDFAIS